MSQQQLVAPFSPEGSGQIISEPVSSHTLLQSIAFERGPSVGFVSRGSATFCSAGVADSVLLDVEDDWVGVLAQPTVRAPPPMTSVW